MITVTLKGTNTTLTEAQVREAMAALRIKAQNKTLAEQHGVVRRYAGNDTEYLILDPERVRTALGHAESNNGAVCICVRRWNELRTEVGWVTDPPQSVESERPFTGFDRG